MSGPSNIPNNGPIIDMVRWTNSDGSLEVTPTVNGCWSSHMFRHQPLSKAIMCGNAGVALSHYTKGSETLSKSARDQKSAAKCADKWRQFIKDNCDDRGPPKVTVPSVQTAQTEPKTEKSTTRAFWATTPFQIMAATQQMDREISRLNQEIGSHLESVNTQAIGAVAFIGFTIGAIYQLRFGNTAPLGKVVESL